MPLLEVESKFAPTAIFKRVFGLATSNKPNGVQERFSYGDILLRRSPKRQIRDTYYDLDNKLSTTGLWVRWRQTRMTPGPPGAASVLKAQWEAKTMLGGCDSNSIFEEVEGRQEIAALLQARYGIAMEDLTSTADLVTQRLTWDVFDPHLADECAGCEMSIVFDAAKEHDSTTASEHAFTHDIGEVEITQHLETTSEDAKKHAAVRMRKFLDEFMRRHEELFQPEIKPVGKLGAYFAWKEVQTRQDAR